MPASAPEIHPPAAEKWFIIGLFDYREIYRSQPNFRLSDFRKDFGKDLEIANTSKNGASSEGIRYRFGEFEVDPANRSCTRDGVSLAVSGKVYEILLALVENPGRLLSKDELLERVWPNEFVEEGNLARNVSTLRKALGDNGKEHKYILTVPGHGYRFIPDVLKTVPGQLEFVEEIVEPTAQADETDPDCVPKVDKDGTAGITAVGIFAPRRRFAGRLWRGPLIVAVCGSAVAFVSVFTFSHVGGHLPPQNDGELQKPKFYWEMSDGDRNKFIRSRVAHVQNLIGDETDDLNDESIGAIRTAIDNSIQRRESMSQEPFKEGLRSVYGRASQYVPLISREYEKHNVPPALGIYQAMIESEYRDCFINEFGNFGMFQFTRRTGHKYGLTDGDRCKVNRQSEAAARYMSDLLSDFGVDKASWTLALLSYNNGEDQSREQLREIRSLGITERTFWTIFQNREKLKSPLIESSQTYVPRFFAAAVIGESPESFDLVTPPLSSLR